VVAHELTPFLPEAARRIAEALSDLDGQRARSLFPKFEEVGPTERAARSPR
jgi:hypothetical protein